MTLFLQVISRSSQFRGYLGRFLDVVYAAIAWLEMAAPLGGLCKVGLHLPAHQKRYRQDSRV